MSLAGVVRALREKLGISRRELARRTGIDRSYLDRLETGTARWPDVHLPALARIADCLGVSVAEIMTMAYPSTDPETELRAHRMHRLFQSLPAARQEEMLAIAETLLSLSHPEGENT